MSLLIYRASNGATYPGIVLRLLIAVLLFGYSISFTKMHLGDIFLPQNRLKYGLVLLSIILIQEFIYGLHLWAIRKIYTDNHMWQYVVFQFGITVGVFTNLIHRAIFHFGLDYLNSDPFFVHETLTILNCLYIICYMAYARKYTQYLLVERNGEKKLMRVIDIATFSFTPTYIYINDKKLRAHGIFSRETSKEFITKLDPRYFELIEGNAIINRKHFGKNFEKIKAVFADTNTDYTNYSKNYGSEI
jgi:hypothetical protein